MDHLGQSVFVHGSINLDGIQPSDVEEVENEELDRKSEAELKGIIANTFDDLDMDDDDESCNNRSNMYSHMTKESQVHEITKTDPEYWERLPNEILENILIMVPTYQLPIRGPWVCKKWTRIIFQPWYWVHKLKRHGIIIEDKIWSVLQEFEYNEIVSCLYYASQYQEHHTQKTPIPDFGRENTKENEYCYYKYPSYSGKWNISNNFDILKASGFLVCRSYRSVCLYLNNKNMKSLPLLLKLLKVREASVYVMDDYAFWNFYPRLDYLQILKGSSDEARHLKKFRGCLKSLEGLPSSIEYINISIGVDDQNIAIDPGFSRINKNTEITLHLRAGTNISNLPKIATNYTYSISIIVSGLEQSHITWMIEVTNKFLDPGNQCLLAFLNYQLDLKASENLFKSIAKAGFNFSSDIVCSSPTLGWACQDVLNDLTYEFSPLYASGFHLFASDDILIAYLHKLMYRKLRN